MSQTRWRKSRRSAQEGNCVELAYAPAAVRDSKYSGHVELVLPVGDLPAFLGAIKGGRFDPR